MLLGLLDATLFAVFTEQGKVALSSFMDGYIASITLIYSIKKSDLARGKWEGSEREPWSYKNEPMQHVRRGPENAVSAT